MLTLSSGERAGVRASQITNFISSTVTTKANIKSILCSTLLLCHAFVSPLLADDVITNVMSPIVSYQYPDDFNTQALTNGGIISPIVSYQYYEWPGDDVLGLSGSRPVSYFYPGNDGPLIPLHGRVTGPSGTALPGASVSAAFGSIPLAQTTTDMNGNYSLSLGAGLYALTVSVSGHAKSSRVLTLSAGTAAQNFQLAALPAAPGLQDVSRSPTVNYAAGQMGELKVFDGANFVSLNDGNAPHLDRMTIVMTHGFASNPEAWAKGMAVQMQTKGVTLDVANILCWDWHEAAIGPLSQLPVAYSSTGEQGIGLGRELQTHLGVGYFKELHFLGHSLGTLVNATAVNYLRGDKLGHEEVSQIHWISKPIHVTLFDHAEAANLLNQNMLYDGISVNLVEAWDRLESGADYTWDLKRSMPVSPTWADNFVSLVGSGHPNAVNVLLQKASLLFGPVNPHSYSWWWYGNSVANPTDALNPLGFQRSYEYVRATGLPISTFPPASTEFPQGSWYQQVASSSDVLALERQQTLGQRIGTLANNVVHGTIGAVQTVGNVAVEIRDGAQAAGQWIVGGFDYVGNRALQGKQSLVNLFDSAVLRLQLQTTSPSSPSSTALRGGPQPQDADAGGGVSNSPPMAWLPIRFPANATAMAFDFTVEGNPMDDVLVCGIGTNNLFSVQAKYVPTNTFSASRLIDVSAWAGTTNELFFGFLGGTSTNAALQIENIRFYSLEQPRLEITRAGNALLLSWPTTAAGYSVESTVELSGPNWQPMINAPVVVDDRYVLTNSAPAISRFFRLRQ